MIGGRKGTQEADIGRAECMEGLQREQHGGHRAETHPSGTFEPLHVSLGSAAEADGSCHTFTHLPSYQGVCVHRGET